MNDIKTTINEFVTGDTIISPDTLRQERIPPGQSRTAKWPVLDAAGPPPINMAKWQLFVEGFVGTPISWDWDEIRALPRIKVYSDFHCVTRWSRLSNVWEGVSTRELVKFAGGISPEATHVLIHAYDFGWTTNVSVEDFLAEDALIAFSHDGEPLTLEHGGPARLVIPRLYAWKSAKWISGVEFLAGDKAGFWERNGYHMHGDPWKEERFSC